MNSAQHDISTGEMHKAILVSICVMGKQIFEQDVKMYVKFGVVKKKKKELIIASDKWQTGLPD